VGRDQSRVDVDLDGVPDTSFSFPTAYGSMVSDPGQIAVAWDPGGALVGMRCRELGDGTCSVEYARDADADLALDDETGVSLELLSTNLRRLWSPSIAFDAGGRPVLGYVKRVIAVTAVVARDADGNGDFTGSGERIDVAPVSGVLPNLGELAIDAGGRVAYLHAENGLALRLAYDLNGDGDYADVVAGNPELATIASGAVACVGAARGPDGNLALVYETQGGPTLARDGNGDGDFGDPGETTTLAAGITNGCDVAARPGGPLAVVHDVGGGRLLVDADADGDFDDPGELVTLQGSPRALLLNAAGAAFVVDETRIWPELVP
jgi:hypothetical protein